MARMGRAAVTQCDSFVGLCFKPLVGLTTIHWNLVHEIIWNGFGIFCAQESKNPIQSCHLWLKLYSSKTFRGEH